MEVVDPLKRRLSSVKPPARAVLGINDVYRSHRGRIVPSIKGLFSHFSDEGRVTLELAVRLVSDATELMRKEPTVVDVPAPCVVVGDIHGQFYDLTHILRDIQPPGQTHSYLFLGDYTDRGAFSWECLLLLCALKVRYPSSVYLLCGNHEDRTMNHAFTFLTELRHKVADTPGAAWGSPEFVRTALTDPQAQSAFRASGFAGLSASDSGAETMARFVYAKILNLYQAFPLAAVLDKRFFCVHGGVGPDLPSVDHVRRLDRFAEHMPGHATESSMEDRVASARGIRTRRPAYEPNAGYGESALRPSTPAVQSLLWSDPAPSEAPASLRFVPNRRRGAGHVFGFAGASAFLRESHLLAIIRGHEVKEAGFEFGPAHPETRFPVHFTIFSAAHYAGHYPNRGAVLVITPDNISVRQFASQPQPFVLPGFQDALRYIAPVVAEASCDMFTALLKVVSHEDDAQLTALEEAGDEEAWQALARPAAAAPPSATAAPIGSAAQTGEPGAPAPARRSPAELAELRSRLRSKLRAITIFRNMQNTLRTEREACLRLKALNGGQLPYGMLRHGAAGVQQALATYEAAAAADLVSEALPSALPGDAAERAADVWAREQRAAACRELAALAALERQVRADSESAGSDAGGALDAALDASSLDVKPLPVQLVRGRNGQFSFAS